MMTIFDAIVIGGSFAGLSAAIHIARGGRTVCVIDSGLPRNRFAEESHGFFAQDGAPPGAMIAAAKAQVSAYPTVSTLAGEAIDAFATGRGFAVMLADGTELQAARLVLAFGIVDQLPDIPGLVQRWGRTALHCPYCHGYEFSGRRLGVLRTGPMSAHQAQLIAEWGPTTYFLNGGEMPDAELLDQLHQRKVVIQPEPVSALLGEGTSLSAIALADGQEIALDALYLAPTTRLASPIAEKLGCALREGPLGPIIVTDDTRITSVPGVYAAGDIARAPHNATWAAADGVTAGTSLHQSLIFASAA